MNAQLANGNIITAHRFIAEDDCVVVEGRGHNTTTAGTPYQNTYCWVFRFEYADTALMQSTLQPPR